MPRIVYVIRPRYRIRSFIFDLFMVAITGGLWLIWIFVREMRRQY